MPPEVNLHNEKNNGECLLRLINKNFFKIDKFLVLLFENNFRYFSNVTPKNAWKKSYSPKEFKIPLFVAFSNFWSGQLKLCLRHGIFRE